MTDVAGRRDDPGRRGLVELRLDELFPQPSMRPVRSRFGRGSDDDDDGLDDGGGLNDDGGGWDQGARWDKGARWGDLDVGEPDVGELAEPDPFHVDHRDLAGARAPAQTAGEAARAGQPGRPGRPGQPGQPGRSGRSGRLAALGALARLGRWRIDPERRGAVAVMAAILVAALAVGWQAVAHRPQAEPVSGATLVSGTGSAALVAGSPVASAPRGAGSGTTAATTGAAKVVVDVVGRVHRPGLVTLPAGARVADAVRAAGGALAGTNLASINLARVCVDGEQIAVGVVGATAPAGTGPAGAASGSGASTGLVNLNTATADQLDALPGVGPVMAQRIIAYRTDHGPFTAVSQLQQVSGIGAARYADLSPLVTV